MNSIGNVLGIDPSGSRCGLAIVNGDKLLWHDVVHFPDNINPLTRAAGAHKKLLFSLADAWTNHGFASICMEDATVFAGQTFRGKTKRATNLGAVIGFGYAKSIVLASIVYITAIENMPCQEVTPTQWQCGIGADSFMPDTFARHALATVNEDADQNRKRLIRCYVAWRSDKIEILATKKKQNGEQAWIWQQDSLDAAGIGYWAYDRAARPGQLVLPKPPRRVARPRVDRANRIL